MILVVDDEPQIVHAIKLLLETKGYAVATASSCDEGLTFLHENTPELILSDICMPHETGLEFVRKVRAKANFQDTPIIMISALGHKEVLEDGLKSGADDYITKPFQPESLLNCIHTHLKFHSDRKTGTPAPAAAAS